MEPQQSTDDNLMTGNSEEPGKQLQENQKELLANTVPLKNTGSQFGRNHSKKEEIKYKIGLMGQLVKRSLGPKSQILNPKSRIPNPRS